MYRARFYSTFIVLLLALLAACSGVEDLSLAIQGQNINRYEERFTFHNVFPLTDEAKCVGYPGTVTVDGSGVARITEFIAGPNAGNFQVLQRVEGTVTFEADDPETYPVTYLGSYVENTNVRGNRKNFRYSDHLLLTATGTDGSVVKFSFNIHYLLRDGEVQVDIFKVNCIR